MDKVVLDNILEKHQAQPVGHGYIDIIVSRNNYKNFVRELVTNGFKVESVSWWEWCADNKPHEYGLGGPESIFYKGWFSEIPVTIDEFNFPMEKSNEEMIEEIINKIESKTITFSNETVLFNKSNWLTPAIWLDVPNDWRKKYSR